MNESKKRIEAERAEKAKQLLENQLLKEAFEYIEDDILSKWKGTHSADHDARHNAYLMYRLLQEFRDYFTRTIAQGRQAQKDLNINVRDSKIRRLVS